MTFTDLGLAPKILKAIAEMGYETPTPIQAQAIPPALQNRDVLGIAQTGTGKTGAFTLPTLHKLERGRARARMPRCLIVCPTRELAAQAAENVELYGKYLKLEMALLIGGVSFAEQDRKLTKGVDILIATPGRLLDQFERGKILMTGVQTLIVDEADRMLDMGFIPDIERIFEITPFTRQVLFFSATMPAEIKRLVDTFLHQPVTVQIARRNSTAKTVRQRIARLPTGDAKVKRGALRWIMEREDIDNGIIFCNRKKDVDIVAKSLQKYGLKAEPIHGDLPQSVRTKTLERFKEGDFNILVASDVAARGLDVDTITHVFNYDVPFHSEDYIHRIGRTGRAGRKGDAIMLVAPLDDKNYDQILDLINKDAIEEIDIPDIDSFPREGKGRGRSGGRSSGGRGGRSGGRTSGRSNGRDRDGGRSGGSRKRSEPREDSVDAKPVAEPKREAKPEDKPARRSATTARRRAAPGRKKPKDDATETAKPARRNDAKRDEAKQAEPAREKPKRARRSDERDDKPAAKSRSRNSRSGSRSSGKTGGKAGGKDSVTGFGGEMPSFFQN